MVIVCLCMFIGCTIVDECWVGTKLEHGVHMDWVERVSKEWTQTRMTLRQYEYIPGLIRGHRGCTRYVAGLV